MNRILTYIISDIIKNKIVIVYCLILAAFSWSTFSVEDNHSKGLLSVLNIILLIVPLVSILFSTIYIYNSREFIELLLSHPIKRSRIWTALFLGLCASLVTAFLLGAGLPVLLFVDWQKSLMMIIVGIFMTIIFVAMALISTIISNDKAKGIGISIMVWLYFALLFDGLVLFLLFQFSDYPIEKFMVFMSALSPVDLSRILILMQLDVSAMMGYTGAIFKNFFGSSFGLVLTFTLLLIWSILPYSISLRIFQRKDL